MLQTDTIHRRLLDARHRFERAGIEAAEAAVDADVLARHALGGWERGQLIVRLHDACPAGFAGVFEALVRRRERREPTGYIVGHREFWNLDIEVGADVLIPRPETELLVEATLASLSSGGRASHPGSGVPPPRKERPPIDLRLADVGTGSGCVAVALARWLPSAMIVAIDASEAALAVARRNAARQQVSDRVYAVRGDLLAAVRGPFDAVVSNPPYVPVGDVARLQPEVRDWEPVGALVGGLDGLDAIRRLVPQAAGVLGPGGWLLFEFGFGQREGVQAIVTAEPRLELTDVLPDLAGIPRVAVARRT